MTLIETEWHQIKTHELAGQIFEDEYDLAIAIINENVFYLILPSY